MIFASFLCCIFLAVSGVTCNIKDLYVVPVCEDKGPQDVYLDLSYSDLDKLSRSSVFDSSIKCLNYEGNNIHEIVSDAFDDVPELFFLNLANNPINYEDLMGIQTPNVETLILDGCSRRDRYGNYYSYNSYERRNTEASLYFDKLRKLSLRSVPTSEQINSWLSVLNVPGLTHLYLSGNGINTISNLASMPNLTHVNLDNNKMGYISGLFFKNVEYLSMDRNHIKNVCGTICRSNSMSTHGMHNLKYLSLADNSIENIGFDAFVDLENLDVLNLAGNQIHEFQQHAFDNMTKLKNLTLDRNRLGRVPEICALQELQILSLNENRIVNIDEKNFCNMKQLAMLYLRNNGMTNIADKTFANLPALSTLDLSCNNLYILPEKWIMPNNQLNVLHLDGNQFSEIGDMSLKTLDALTTLSFIHNPIDEVSIKSLIELPLNITIKLSLDSQPSKNVCLRPLSDPMVRRA